MADLRLAIIGTRGIPARHGGFETFAERLAVHLVNRGWKVTVYCQADAGPLREDSWCGVYRITIPSSRGDAWGTIAFDWTSVVDCARRRFPAVLMLGYNTAVFSLLLRARTLPTIINMDGLEWRRAKWRHHERLWLWLNERLACRLANHLIADHPAIAEHLEDIAPTERITMIPYGADAVTRAERRHLEQFSVHDCDYAIVIARPEPENSLLEVVTAFSRRRRNARLVILGHYDPARNGYHARVMAAASEEVMFVGPIYEKEIVHSLRYAARFYVHGHRVGGTNPSLVEALGASNAVLAHDNVFNRWVVGSAGLFFSNIDDCDESMSLMLSDAKIIEQMRHASSKRFESSFQWNAILEQYESILQQYVSP